MKEQFHREVSAREQSMYDQEAVARLFDKRQENYKHRGVSAMSEKITMDAIEGRNEPQIADLGAGSHVDRYMQLRGELEESGGTLHWVDVSEHMLALANERLEESDDFVQLHQQDALSFLREQKTCSLDVVKMTYAFGHLENLDEFFVSLAHALTQDGVFVSTISANNRLKSHSSNAAFFVNGDRVPESGYELTDGESYTIKFFTETGNPEASFLEGAETTKRYFSKEAIVAAAEAQGFTASFEMHERSEFDEKGGEEKQMTQEFLIVSKV